MLLSFNFIPAVWTGRRKRARGARRQSWLIMCQMRNSMYVCVCESERSKLCMYVDTIIGHVQEYDRTKGLFTEFLERRN